MHLSFDAKNMQKLALKTKFLASLAFVGFAWDLGAWDTTYGRLVLLALVLCLAGDVLLALKDKSRNFLLGIGAFLLAHLVYAGAFLQFGFNNAQLPLIRLLIFAVLAVLIITGLWLRPHLQGKFKLAVPAYLVAIGLMLISALGNQSLSAFWWIVCGATLFAVSDLFVTRHRFIQPAIINRIIGLPIYYTAQLMLAYSVSL